MDELYNNFVSVLDQNLPTACSNFRGTKQRITCSCFSPTYR